MIDIHCHLLYDVDDGPDTMEESVAMLEKAAEQGVTDIILTPHYRRGMFKFEKDRALEHKAALEKYAQDFGITLYLGTEIHVNGDILEYLENGRVMTLADSEYVLTEYAYETEFSYILRMTQELIRYGYIPVIAHVERYRCLVQRPQCLEELQELGALIQMNAGAILGKEGWGVKGFCKKALNHGWVDLVASDSHDIKKRVCYMGACYDYLSDKYGEKLADRLMTKNPMNIIQGE